MQQNQEQRQSQNNNQIINATGGSASIGNIEVEVQNPAVRTVAAPEVLGEKTPVVVESLPKTGLPVAAWALSGFLPAGFGIKRFAKGLKDNKDSASFIWQLREFGKDN